MVLSTGDPVLTFDRLGFRSGGEVYILWWSVMLLLLRRRKRGTRVCRLYSFVPT